MQKDVLQAKVLFPLSSRSTRKELHRESQISHLHLLKPADLGLAVLGALRLHLESKQEAQQSVLVNRLCFSGATRKKQSDGEAPNASRNTSTRSKNLTEKPCTLPAWHGKYLHQKMMKSIPCSKQAPELISCKIYARNARNLEPQTR